MVAFFPHWTTALPLIFIPNTYLRINIILYIRFSFNFTQNLFPNDAIVWLLWWQSHLLFILTETPKIYACTFSYSKPPRFYLIYRHFYDRFIISALCLPFSCMNYHYMCMKCPSIWSELCYNKLRSMSTPVQMTINDRLIIYLLCNDKE